MRKKMFWTVVMLMGVYLWLNSPTFHDGLFQVYDNVQVTRVEAMYHELVGGQFPVRYIDAWGHGAGSFLFKYYSPLIYYVGAMFHSGGFTYIQSVKLVYLLMTAIGAMGIWGLLRCQVKWGPATLGSIAFLSSPYVYHDFFHRGSLTEASAFMLLPWVWWMFIRLKTKTNGANLAVASLALGITMLTHSLTGVMALSTVILLCLILVRCHRKQVAALMWAIVLGMGIAAFSLVPSLAEKQYISYENNSLVQRGYLDHPIAFLHQWTNSGVGTEKSAFTGFTLMVGWVMLLALYIGSKQFRTRYGPLALFALGVSTGGLYLMSPSSAALWERIIYLRYFQFPFRLLTVTTTALALGYAMILDHYATSKVKTGLLVMLIFVPWYMARGYYRPLGYQYGTNYTVDDPCMTNTWANEYLSKWSEKCLLKPELSLVSSREEGGEVSQIEVKQNGREISFHATGTSEVQVAKYFFPDWQAYDERGNKLTIKPIGAAGLIGVSVPSTSARIFVKLGRTMSEKWGDLISVGSLASAVWLLWRDRWPRLEQATKKS